MNKKGLSIEYGRRLVFCWVFIFLFFIVYNLATKIGFFPKYFGGYYTFSIVLSSVLVGRLFFCHFFSSLKSLLAKEISFGDGVNIVFLIFLVLFFIRVILGYFEGADFDVVLALAGAAVQFTCLYVICVYMPINGFVFFKVNFVSFIIASILIFIFYALGGNDFVISGLSSGVAVDYELNYQGVALAYALLTVFGISCIRGFPVRMFFWAVSFGLLFLIGARSEFVLVLVAFLCLEFFFNRDRFLSWVWKGLFALLIAMVSIFLFLTGYSFEIDTRIAGLLDVSKDESMIARSYLNHRGYQTIEENIIFGDFASYAPGQYMHNFFSSWVDLGFAGFFLLLSAFVLCAIGGCLSRLTKERSIVLSLLASCAILLVFVKAYFYILVPVVLGLFVGAYSKSLVGER